MNRSQAGADWPCDSSNGRMNALYCGDNLTILREHVKDESADLVHLDPPFNSNANYNVLLRAPDGHESHAQMEAEIRRQDTYSSAYRATSGNGYPVAAFTVAAFSVAKKVALTGAHTRDHANRHWEFVWQLRIVRKTADNGGHERA